MATPVVPRILSPFPFVIRPSPSCLLHCCEFDLCLAEPEEFIVIPTRLIITAACQVIMLIIVNIFYVTQLCPWVEGSMTWPLINEDSLDYDLYSCKTAMILSDVAGLSPEAFCPGTFDVNAGSLDQACRCTYSSGFSDNVVQSTHAAFAVCACWSLVDSELQLVGSSGSEQYHLLHPDFNQLEIISAVSPQTPVHNCSIACNDWSAI